MAEKLYSADQVERCLSGLTELAKQPRTTFTAFAAIETLCDSIITALKNHTYDEVAKQLNADGIDITAGTLKQYVRRIEKQRQQNVTQTSTKRKRKSKKTPESVDMLPEATANQPNLTGHPTRLPEVDINDIRVAY